MFTIQAIIQDKDVDET